MGTLHWHLIFTFLKIVTLRTKPMVWSMPHRHPTIKLPPDTRPLLKLHLEDSILPSSYGFCISNVLIEIVFQNYIKFCKIKNYNVKSYFVALWVFSFCCCLFHEQGLALQPRIYLKLMILLPRSPECWDDRQVASHPPHNVSGVLIRILFIIQWNSNV